MTTCPDAWVTYREETGWHLYQSTTGTMIRANCSGNLHWVERVTPEDRARLERSIGPDWWQDHMAHRIADAKDERDAEQFILALGDALGAVRITDYAGRLMNDGPAQMLLMEDV